MLCPDCGSKNIEGSESCASCGGSLVDDIPSSDVERGITSHSVNVLCPREAVCVQVETPVRDVVALMAQKNAGCVLVENGADLVGVFSERDMLNKVSSDLDRLGHPVSEFMTPKPFTITKRDSIGYALQAMDVGGYRHLPVVNASGIAIGILSVRDILRFLCIRYAKSRG